MKSYNHISQNERFFIDSAYNEQHMSIRKIANTLGKSPSTISREIKNGSVLGDYVYLIADIKAQSRSWHKHSIYLLKYQEFTNLFKQIYNKKCCGVYLAMHLIKEKYPMLFVQARDKFLDGWNLIVESFQWKID